jgi:hypothetical protein
VIAETDIERRWEVEALRLYRRYQIEIVEALGLCPWAPRARIDGRMRERVLLQTRTTLRPSLEAIDALDADPAVEVAVFLYPRLRLDLHDFRRFAGRVRAADARRRELGAAPFVIAVFHPDAETDDASAERLVPFLRRTPDPTLQLVRATVLDRVRSGAPQGTQLVVDLDALERGTAPDDELPMHERIARANFETVTRVGLDDVARRLDDVRADRVRSYAALAK